MRVDPKTVAWLESNFNPVFGFPNVARFSWAPVKNALLKKGVQSKWCASPFCLSLVSTVVDDFTVSSSRCDEAGSIQKYFSGETTGPEKAPLWKDLSLVSVGEF